MWFCTLVGGSCGSSADNPAIPNVQCMVVAGMLCKEYLRPPSKFSVFGESDELNSSKALYRLAFNSASSV